MKNKTLKHLIHYVVLLTIMFLGIIFFSVSGHTPILQIAVVVALSFFYLAWGIIHHLIEKNLYLEVFLEYLLFSFLGAVLTIALILYL
jgi:predicted tellurium resistance membrane protein TerC